MMNHFNEDTIEQAALELLREVGYSYAHGGEIAPGEHSAERSSYGDVLLVERLRASLHRINDHIPAAVRAQVIAEALPRLTRTTSQSLLLNNYEFHKLLTDGVDVSYREGSQQRHAKLWLVDTARPHYNDWLAVNQFTVEDVNPLTRTRTNRRPDIVLFVNGLPLAVIELKNAADEDANLEAAWHQLQTYKDEISPLFTYNVLLAISDGTYARLGTLTSGWEHFKPWRTIDGTVLPKGTPELEPLIKGVFAPDRLLDILRYFIVFERDEAKLVKKVAAYHQYHAVNKALASTLDATSAQGDKRVGVVWHTQGSGKSLSMLFYAGKIIQQPQMQNPTLVILTDRNDLDDQLFGTFASGQELLRQTPVQALDRSHLRELLRVVAGGVVFTTIQKFMPEDGRDYPLLSERRNIVFIADEAHRSQYGFEARLIQRADYATVGYGFAKYVRDALPNASFIGFTGTPVETTDANTRQVFGDYIDIYDIQRAVDDGATVPIYYEARLATLRLREDQRPQIDPSFDEITEGEEDYIKDKLKTKWAQLEAAVGSEERLAQIAQDIITHFEQRLEVLDGKGMIVCMSRRIAVDLYNQFIQLRPEWHSADDTTGTLKVIMTGSASDPAHYQPHVRNKPRRKAIAERFKEPTDSLKLVIVRDMWLTGFDVPPLHTMYLDKPMYGHGLMQAIARVNRVFKDKPGGLVVDYLGIAPELREAVQQYTLAGSGRPAVDVDEAVQILLTEHDVVKNFFRRFDYSAFFSGTPLQRLRVIPAAMEYVLEQPDGKKRYLDTVTRLTKAFALSVPDARALALRDDVAFFQAVRAAIAKISTPEGKSEDDLNNAVKQIVSQAIASENIVNILDAAGIKSPDISILSDEFLDDLRHLPQKNVALELLRKLIADEVKARSRQNVVQARSFSEMLDQTIRRYQNRAVDAAQIITELIDIAKEIRQAQQRGDELGLGVDELAFYDALANNISARDVLGDQQLAVIAVELLKSVRQSVTIDWAVKQSARAKIRVLVKRILKQYGYPPDLQEAATNLVLEQAELLAAQWVG